MATYKRNAPYVQERLVELPSGKVITRVPCKIQVPVRYTEIGLGQIGIDTFIYGLFPIIYETGDYAVCNINALVEINPYKTTKTTIEDVEYYEFFFEADQVVIKATDLVKRESMLYDVFSEFIFKGKIPWYVSYEDLGKLFDTSSYHAGSNINQNLEVIEFIASMVTRSKDDRTKYIRNVANTIKDYALDKVDYVPLKSVFYSVNSTVNKLAGSYFNDGVVSALVNPTDSNTKLEKILRA